MGNYFSNPEKITEQKQTSYPSISPIEQAHISKFSNELLQRMKENPSEQFTIIVVTEKNIKSDLELLGMNVTYVQDYGTTPIMIAGTVQANIIEEIAKLSTVNRIRLPAMAYAC